MKNGFYSMLKALFVIKILKLLYWLVGHTGKPLDKKAKVNFKIYDVKDWQTNKSNTYIAHYLKK